MIKTKFVEKIQETPTDWSFRFEVPDGYVYKAAQYSVIRLDLMYPDTRSNARTCSTSSSPTEKYIQFTFTIRDTGFKKTLMEMTGGTEVEITPARGKMILDEVVGTHCVMIAGGIGVAPYRGIAKYAYDVGLASPKLTLLYSDKTIDEIAYKAEFDKIMEAYPNFQVVYTLTRHTDSHGHWDGLQGRIGQEFITHNVADIDTAYFMVCGPVEMVQGTVAQLQELGVPRERINAELFTGY